jgi:predicted  nucleic acid-binding Zn-ribbon protein
VQLERPQTSASTVSHEEDLDSWAMQVEKIRMQRNDAAVQLKGMKKSRHNLKKTLRDTDAQLHRLEKETKT